MVCKTTTTKVFCENGTLLNCTGRDPHSKNVDKTFLCVVQKEMEEMFY